MHLCEVLQGQPRGEDSYQNRQNPPAAALGEISGESSAAHCLLLLISVGTSISPQSLCCYALLPLSPASTVSQHAPPFVRSSYYIIFHKTNGSLGALQACRAVAMLKHPAWKNEQLLSSQSLRGEYSHCWVIQLTLWKSESIKTSFVIFSLYFFLRAMVLNLWVMTPLGLHFRYLFCDS